MTPGISQRTEYQPVCWRRHVVHVRSRYSDAPGASYRWNAGLTIVGLGEALFDVFPDRTILGGAPLNVAVHAHQLLSGLGGLGIPASRIGRDASGLRLIEELRSRGVPTSGIQYDDERPTGQVRVTLVGGEPRV